MTADQRQPTGSSTARPSGQPESNLLDRLPEITAFFRHLPLKQNVGSLTHEPDQFDSLHPQCRKATMDITLHIRCVNNPRRCDE